MDDPRIAHAEDDAAESVAAGHELEELLVRRGDLLAKARLLLDDENRLGLSLSAAVAPRLASHNETWPLTPFEFEQARAFIAIRNRRRDADVAALRASQDVADFYRAEARRKP